MGLTLLWELVSNREHIHVLLRADLILVGIYAKGGGWADSVPLVDSAGGSLAVYLECHLMSDSVSQGKAYALPGNRKKTSSHPRCVETKPRKSEPDWVLSSCMRVWRPR